jgi:hypothetical protein
VGGFAANGGQIYLYRRLIAIFSAKKSPPRSEREGDF